MDRKEVFNLFREIFFNFACLKRIKLERKKWRFPMLRFELFNPECEYLLTYVIFKGTHLKIKPTDTLLHFILLQVALFSVICFSKLKMSISDRHFALL